MKHPNRPMVCGLAGLLAASLPNETRAQATIFIDTFETALAAGADFTEGAINNELPGGPRQAGGSLSSLYTATLGGTGGQIGLNANEILNGTDDVLMFRRNGTSNPNEKITLSPNVDFATVAGSKWTLSLDFFGSTNSGTMQGRFMVSVGDSPNPGEPSSANSDFGLVFNLASGGTTLWSDNVNSAGPPINDGAGAGGTNGDPGLWGERYHLTLTFDETGGIGNVPVTGTITAYGEGGGAVAGTQMTFTTTIGFDGSSRYVELNSYRDSNTGILDTRIDNLSVATAASESLKITGVSLSGTELTVTFETAPGQTGFTVEGSTDLLGFPIDKTGDAVITEPSAGSYSAVIDVSGEGPRFFVRIAKP